MKTKKYIKRIFSFVLATILLFSTIPVSLAVQDMLVEEVDAKIVREVTELREESVKHFLCEDGSYIAATYSEPVHYIEDGVWKEFDNRLVLNTKTLSKSGKPTYTPKSSDFSVSIPQSFEDDQQITAENRGYEISFGLNKEQKEVTAPKTATATTINNRISSVKAIENVAVQNVKSKKSNSISIAEEVETYNADIMAIDNQSSAITYQNVFLNTDLEYVLSSNCIKENIVVKQKQNEYIYSFDMDFGELLPVVNKDNSIRLVNSENSNETIFYIASPYMYDANNEETTDIEMLLEKKGDIYVMTLVADTEWINDENRVFPVVIDPTIYLPDSDFSDVFVINGLYANSTKVQNELRVGKNLTNLTRTYIKMEMPTTLSPGCTINKAYLRLTQDYYYKAPFADNISINVYDCKNVPTWKSHEVSWNNQPYSNSENGYKTSGTYLDSKTASSSASSYTFDITPAVQRWINGEPNNGLMLASSNESTKTQVDLCSSRVSDTANRPEMWFTYSLPSVSMNTWNTAAATTTSSTITVTAAKNWTATTDQSWITIMDKTNTSFRIKVSNNPTLYDRNGTVTIKVDNIDIGAVTVSQLGASPSVTISEYKLFADCSGLEKSVNIITNTTLDISTTDNWITFETEQIDAENYKLNISVSENNTFEPRTGKIKLTYSSAHEPEELKITQFDETSKFFYEINSDNNAITLKESSEYNHSLATWAMHLSSTAYNPLPDDMAFDIPLNFMTEFETIENVLNSNHFKNIKQYHYDDSQLNTAAHTIAHKKIVDNDGSYKTLITVTIRGTASTIEWLTNVLSLLQCQEVGFLGAKNNVIDDLNAYIEEYSSSFEDDKIILVTGHSMGAAVANLVASELNNSENWNTNEVYAYTFATPNVGNNITTDYTNIFNILNRSDYITLVPCSLLPSAVAGDYLWGRHGIDIPISMTIGNNVADNHKMDTYYNFMISKDSNLSFTGIKEISDSDVSMGILPKLLSMKCPVGATVYNSNGVVMASAGQQESHDGIEDGLIQTQSVSGTTSDIVSWVSEDGEKIFFIPYGSDASKIEIEAYDYGTMTFSIASMDASTNLPNSIKTFENVSLYPEKEFRVNLSEDISIEDTQLFVIENDEIIEEITDLHPLLKSVSIDNTNIAFGSQTELTIITSNEVSEIKLINSSTDVFETYDANNSSVISVVEDDNDLVWTIHTVFPEGYWEYDIAVKSGDDWYHTNKVFAVDVS